jgi:hypothetical protein
VTTNRTPKHIDLMCGVTEADDSVATATGSNHFTESKLPTVRLRNGIAEAAAAYSRVPPPHSLRVPRLHAFMFQKREPGSGWPGNPLIPGLAVATVGRKNRGNQYACLTILF